MPAYPAHSLLVWQSRSDGPGDTPATILPAIVERLRAQNREDGSREISLAITHCEEALHWLQALEQKGRSA